jgi:hypothetical protein
MRQKAVSGLPGVLAMLCRAHGRHFPQVSKKYLAFYVAEFRFRYNNRENADIFGTAIKGC